MVPKSTSHSRISTAIATTKLASRLPVMIRQWNRVKCSSLELRPKLLASKGVNSDDSVGSVRLNSRRDDWGKSLISMHVHATVSVIHAIPTRGPETAAHECSCILLQIYRNKLGLIAVICSRIILVFEAKTNLHFPHSYGVAVEVRQGCSRSPCNTQ